VTPIADIAAPSRQHEFGAPMHDDNGQSERGHAEAVAFLGTAATHGRNVERVERLETHGALIFIAGDNVYKIKRPVRFSYMDFSTIDLRHRACLREIEVNRPHAPEIYLGVVAVTREADGALALDGRGTPIEWAVHMRRFAQEDLLATIAETRGIDAALARRVADAVCDYHRDAPVVRMADAAQGLARVIDELAETLREERLGFDAARTAALDAALRTQHRACAALLDARGSTGFVRRCHGDLHLGNIVLWQGRPTLFDAIEFDDTIATIDTLYDLAFLLMDLDRRGQRPAANTVLNRTLRRAAKADLEGLSALPLMLALRAAIRAMVLAQRAAQRPDGQAASAGEDACTYLDAALDYLTPARPRLVAVGGLSGTGKSTLAAALAPGLGAAPGAVHLRSDLERKAMFGVDETARLPASSYTIETSAHVYETLLAKARAALAAGHAVILDAVFLQPSERLATERLADACAVPFDGLWLVAPEPTLTGRVSTRIGDASDATAEVVRRQAAADHGAIGWREIDATATPIETLRAARLTLAAGGRS
jgi:hypothetical protein